MLSSAGLSLAFANSSNSTDIGILNWKDRCAIRFHFKYFGQSQSYKISAPPPRAKPVILHLDASCGTLLWRWIACRTRETRSGLKERPLLPCATCAKRHDEDLCPFRLEPAFVHLIQAEQEEQYAVQRKGGSELNLLLKPPHQHNSSCWCAVTVDRCRLCEGVSFKTTILRWTHEAVHFYRVAKSRIFNSFERTHPCLRTGLSAHPSIPCVSAKLRLIASSSDFFSRDRSFFFLTPSWFDKHSLPLTSKRSFNRWSEFIPSRSWKKKRCTTCSMVKMFASETLSPERNHFTLLAPCINPTRDQGLHKVRGIQNSQKFPAFSQKVIGGRFTHKDAFKPWHRSGLGGGVQILPQSLRGTYGLGGVQHLLGHGVHQPLSLLMIAPLLLQKRLHCFTVKNLVKPVLWMGFLFNLSKTTHAFAILVWVSCQHFVL